MEKTGRAFSGPELRAAAARMKMTQKDVAHAAGVSPRTVSRVFAEERPSARDGTLEQIARVVGLGEPIASGLPHPFIVVDLPCTALAGASEKLPHIYALFEISMRTRDREKVLERVRLSDATRVTSVSLHDGDLYIDEMGSGIRWGGERAIGARVLDIGDAIVSRSAFERYWKALITGDPIFQFVRSTAGLEFMVMSVAVDRDTRPGIVTVSALGRHFL
ncbi:helix-turn-helix domain-containing protein [Thalassobaculum salexigens]|uniref:helix-turn-helix domain-containing protein n=1 Tax=Thalassobaculum salexigens TaxID=455360 RepID=UPI00146A5854|nr:helix-turn-helix transcriptional regulator [Thalassobaculum salexigens]